MKTREAFCVDEQKITKHVVTIDQNGEYLFVCDCGKSFKLNGDLDKKGITKVLEEHQKENEGKVTLAELTKINEEKLKNI